jgi:hypothetical protein
MSREKKGFAGDVATDTKVQIPLLPGINEIEGHASGWFLR